MPTGAFLLGEGDFHTIYGPELAAEAATLIDIEPAPITREDAQGNPARLANAELILSGWGMVRLTHDILKAAPNLRAVFYGAGSIKGWMTQEAWDRGVRVTTASQVNAVPVVEYALAAILLCLKNAWAGDRDSRAARTFLRPPMAGAYRSKVGLVSLGLIGRGVAQRLGPFDIDVLAHDPYVSETDARAAGANAGTLPLDRLFAECDVLSLHAPSIPQTVGMITRDHLASMKPNAALINTARGAILDEPAMIDVARDRPDLQFVLDVTEPEPPAKDSPLWELPNVFLTPHIAGSMGPECRRMGRAMLDELRRYLAGEPLLYELRPHDIQGSAHAPTKAAT